jgi:hypothetical protein
MAAHTIKRPVAATAMAAVQGFGVHTITLSRLVGQLIRTQPGRPSTSRRLRMWTAAFISVVRCRSGHARGPSPITVSAIACLL